jgi:hypothetical protein
MSLDNPETVDAIGMEKNTGTVVLSILDAWNWADQKGHLLALQVKLNAYFEFVESGQIYQDYPAAAGKSLRIDILSRHPAPAAALAFFKKAATAAAQLNIGITQRTP